MSAKTAQKASGKQAQPRSRAAKPAPARTPGFGRIPVTGISPVVEEGDYPAKAVVDELIPIRATVFREGHDAVNATVVLVNPRGREIRVGMHAVEPWGLDPWEAWVRLDKEGLWHFRIEGWSDPWATWHHNAIAKLDAGQDLQLVCLEGQHLIERTLPNLKRQADAKALKSFSAALDPAKNVEELEKTINDPRLASIMGQFGPRDLVSPTKSYPIQVERKRALYASWYEFFPRSVGAWFDESTGRWHSGTFDGCHQRLEEIAQMGFDVVYLPPIHPIGHSFRKGKNNTLNAGPADPGSPWAIGNEDGGHDAVNPDLGDFDSFDRFVEKAKSLGMEVALDFALQCSPDHPWVKEHPEWFTTRVDGTIAYAENPPKKYQDIYPINFDNDPDGIFKEVVRILELWMAHGVKIFRVDNPHTKALSFWSRLMTLFRKKHPEVIFFAEAFTRPAMMHSLAKLGFQQSYTYFVWREHQWDIQQYMTELTTQTDSFFRPNFFVNTPDINPFYLHSGNQAAFAIRAILAATLSPAWGVYSGFELFEHEPLGPDREEYLNSEKYEYRPRDYNAQPNLNVLIGKLNAIRKHHPALQQLRQFRFHNTTNERILAYSKVDGDDCILVVCSLNPEYTEEGQVNVDLPSLGMGWDDVYQVEDRLTGNLFHWGANNFVRLTPDKPAHIFRVTKN
ncbi:MAG: alpha-1,4-glucan--maltose-1-phosphate maltosyltransferase [Propionibacteriaceae bacterium]|jgi:starch synthase (maltosyl-transferring)|nr:alpha-1,4-glucan--maltose-1-phosphate maltosyltransferase [Propionibacteriaceae bacterium]